MEPPCLDDPEMEPVVFEYRAFFIRLRNPLEPRVRDHHTNCYLLVDDTNYCQMLNWHNSGKSDPNRPYSGSEEDRELLNLERDVWDWLEAWELVELRPIGPEDSEYFATDKLLNGPKGIYG